VNEIGSYLPDLVRRWPDGLTHRRVEGSLVSADISGFTALSERLAAHGREGAEELTVLLNDCFGGMIAIVDEHGGDVLKFGGDALLVLFEGPDHTARAAAACVRMRSLIERSWSTALVRRVDLGISQGIHSGAFDLHLVEAGHRELLVVGPGMSATVNCEGAAQRGQILLSHDAAALLDESCLGESVPEGRVLASAPAVRTHDAPGDLDGGKVDPYVPSWLVEQTAAGRVAEHRTVTVGFVFFGGIDALLAFDGPDAVQQRLQALATAAHDAAERHGAFWLASDVYAGGGKIILTAGAPRSTGQDEDAAVRTARELVEIDIGLPLRVGLNRGPVYMGDLGSSRRRTFTVMGDAVNLAARLMQKSTAGQVVASNAVLDLVPTPFELTPLEPFKVKGKVEPIMAALVGPRIGADTDEPASTTFGERALPFVGRSIELGILREAYDRVSTTTNGVVVDVVGEPGVGKSQLVEEWTADLDATVLRAKGGLYSKNSPYFAVITMLRELFGIDRSATPTVAGRLMSARVLERAPDLEPWLPLLAIAFDAETPMTPEVELIDPANRSARLRDTVVDLLTTAVPGPIVFRIDDAHRLDEASDELFAAISRRLRGRPWMLVAMRWHDHPTFVDDADDVLVVDIGPLAADEAAELARAAAAASDAFDDDDLDDLLARGITNPLFLLELVRSGISGDVATPDSIEALVTARIDTLHARDRLLLREAAVLGSLIDTHVLSEAFESSELRTPDRWEALSGFVSRERDSVYRFRQGLYREVAYQGLAFRRRRELHAAVGRVLERRAGEDWASKSELLSLHFHEAHDWERSWRYSLIAGDSAESKYAHVEAAEFYRRALAVPRAHRPSPSVYASVSETLADVLELAGRFEEASDALAQSRRIRRTTDDDIRLMRKAGILCERRGRYSQALRWYGRGLTALDGLHPPRQAAHAEGELALAYAGVRLRQGRLHDSVRWAQRAEQRATEVGDTRMLAHASYLLMSGFSMLRRPEALHYRTVPLPLFEQIGDLMGQANVLNNLGADANDESQWLEALGYYERGRALFETVGDALGAATAALNIGEILSNQGRLDEAEPLFENALRACRRSGYEVGVAVATCYYGRLLARRGDYDAARAMLADALDRFERIGASYYVVETKAFQLECEVLAGTAEAAATEPVLEAARAVGDPLLEAIVLRAQGWAYLVAHEYDDALRVADRCLALSVEVGSRYETALAHVLRGQALSATGSDPAADNAAARAILTELGVVALPRRVEHSAAPR
jgi:class 3 adenylate cyclase/tetratricopeptide (TPR) repeat protein